MIPSKNDFILGHASQNKKDNSIFFIEKLTKNGVPLLFEYGGGKICTLQNCLK